MSTVLETKSLRSWVALGMIAALAPLILSAGGGFLLINKGVIAPIHDVAIRQRDEIVPAQHLRLLAWDALVSVDEYIQEGNPRHILAYRTLRTQIESGFAALIDAVEGEMSIQTLVERAQENWAAADRYATEITSVPMQSGEPKALERMQQFHGEIIAMSDRLEVLNQQLVGELQKDYDRAILTYERSIWLAGIAAVLSLLAVGGSILLINRIIGASVDRLVDGAGRFATGDRNHRIQVRVPPELRRVAEEFNHMIGQVQDAEKTLIELTRHDSLTGLANRRAFEDNFTELWTRFQRFDEPCCLMAIDIDHFKQINDTYGHAAGDEVLRAVANQLKRNIRPYDTIFRVGGEEFSVLMPKTNVDEARKAAERIRQAIATTPVSISDNEISMTISIGIAKATKGQERKHVMKAADTALYGAKTAGRNRVIVNDDAEVREQNAA